MSAKNQTYRPAQSSYTSFLCRIVTATITNSASRNREVIVPPCRVFFRADEDEVLIPHVMRSERRLRSFLLEHWACLLSHEGCTMLLEKEA